MKLMEVTRDLYSLDEDLTIYAKKPWTCESEVQVQFEPEESLVPRPLEKEGFEYFLEVFVAKEVVPDLAEIEPSFTLEQWCERLIRYAENDA
ncbi:hypothetical protein [Microbulbifer sediminum]|uniref:hypothetical protein n=1 Tax=Microbulbifer sediminum TaxID=2904250 RepID=UPI001F1A2F75|nr:hypothetical protein [Microbulbifer sediminum]